MVLEENVRVSGVSLPAQRGGKPGSGERLPARAARLLCGDEEDREDARDIKKHGRSNREANTLLQQGEAQ